MIKKLFLFILLTVTALQLNAVTVNTTAGKLSTVVTDHNITSLTVNGTLDARDFKFITDELEKLKILDLSGVSIVAYQSTLDDQLIAGEYLYPANTLPRYALTGMTSLTTLTLPGNTIGIDNGALAGCSKLKSINLPYSLMTIADDAFNSCSSLTSVIINGKVNFLGNRVFAHCKSITEVAVITIQPIVIGDDAFADCTSLTSVVIGANVTKIGNGAFNGCTALNHIYFKDESKLEEIGDKAFYNSTLPKINFDRTPLLKHLGAWSLARTDLTQVSIPAHVKSLDEGILFYNKKLTSLELPKTLTYLPDYMLAGCDKINGAPFMTLRMGNIGDYAIYNQSQHSSINVPFNVYYIGTQAMAGMTGLTEITSEPLQVPELGDDVWKGLDQSCIKLNVNQKSVDDYQAAEQWMNFLIGVAQLRGDVNCDGNVNANDAIAERLYILNDITQDINTELTDVNGDSDVNVGDIVSIYNIINGSSPFEHPHRPYFDETIEGNGNKINTKSVKLDILLENSKNYTAFQFYITTPSYISINNASLSERCLGHEVYFTQPESGAFIVMGYSPAGDDIEGNSGAILTLDISSTKAITLDDKITLNRILFADNLENVYWRNNIEINLLGISAIENITVDQNDKPVDVYNTQGQLLRKNVEPNQATQGLPSGIYIVGGKKVIVQ